MDYYSLNIRNTVPKELINEIGIYILYALYQNKLPQPINRVFKTDVAGILYIGETHKQSSHKRIETFKTVIQLEKKATAHSGALCFKEVKVLREKFPIDCLYIRLEIHNNPKQREKQLIENYRQEFGEVPPLNSNK